MSQIARRDLLLAGAAAVGASALPSFASATDQSTLFGSAKTSVQRFLQLQEGVLQRTRAAQALEAPTGAPRKASGTADRILLWHEVALDTNALDYVPPLQAGVPYGEQFGPHKSSRALAVVQLAVFEVVNAQYLAYHSYAGFSGPKGSWSLDAAIAQASHDAQVHLYPPQQQRLDAILADDLANVQDTPANIAAGRAVGTAALTTLLAKLGNDNTTLPEPSIPADYQPSGAYGEWNVDPVSQLTVALGANWPKVIPFTFKNQAQFRAPPPPPAGSDEYYLEFAAVKKLGGDPLQGTATKRTDFETFVGKFWSYDATPGLCAPPRLYNMIARQLILQAGVVDPSPLAHALALINVGMADAGVSAWEAKWHYKFWRPVTGIRWPGAPNGDPNWYPLGAQQTNTGGPNITPPFPAYPSGHATFGGTLFEILRTYLPDNTPFTFISDEWNGVNKDVYGYVRPLRPAHFKSLTDAEYQNAQSRIFIGVHWQADADAGVDQGHRVAQHVLANFAPPRA